MSKTIWGGCCAVITVVLLIANCLVPTAAAEAVNPIGDKGDTSAESAGDYQEIPPSPEIAAERAAQRRINKILDTKLKAPLDYAETPLSEIARILQADFDIPFLFDEPALEDVAISPETEISVNLHNITLREALDLMLMQVPDLTYNNRGPVLLITTEDAANEYLQVKVYRVDDLLDKSQLFNGAEAEDALGELIEVLVHSVESDSWKKNGTGSGEIRFLQPGMLVIAQTQKAHRQIDRLMADIRLAKRQIDITKEHQTSVGNPITRGFKIEVELGEKPKDAREQIADAVKQSVDWDLAKSGLTENDAWIKVLPDRLLVRHLPDVVHQVERVVLDMKLARRDSRGYRGHDAGGSKISARRGGGF